MKMKHTLLAAAALSLLSTTASAVDFGGYFRIGPGQKTNASGAGDEQRCFGGAGIGGKGGIGRLGNECDTYGEFALSQGGEAGGVKYKALVMANFYKPGSAIGDETKLGVQQIYMEGKGFDVAPNQTFWAGRRFYGRADVHMDDTFFVNMTGTGAGVDGIGLGGASLNVGVFRTDENFAGGNKGSRLNLDLADLAVNPGGKLRITAAFTDFSGAGGEGGFGLSLQHNQSGVFGGDNVAWLQLTQGSAGLDMGFGTATDPSSSKKWRIVDSLSWTTGPLTAQTLVQFGRVKTSATTDKFSSLAGRVAYAFTRNFKLQGELGTSSLKPNSGSSQTVTKFTVAPTLTVGPNYYDRPELRLYVSTFSFNSAYRAANGLTKSSRTAAGVQAEMWF